jgi:Kdo2-lipid IVA lauroyltransferase/acyltransferase
VILFLSRIISLLPLSFALKLGRTLGFLGYYLLPIKRSIVMRNLQRVYGSEKTKREMRRIARACYAQLGMYSMELFRLPYLTRELCDGLIERQGFEHLQTAFDQGKGVIILASHMDNVDYAGCSMALGGIPVCVVAREVHWKAAQDFLAAVRKRTGVILIPPRRSKDRIYELLKQNKAVALVVDQHAAKYRSIVCSFFGQLASTSHAPARFAHETGAVIVPGFIYRRGNSGHHVLRFDPPFELQNPHADLQSNIRHNTESLNRIIEGWIREFPEQWLWFHRRWKVQDNPSDWDIPPELNYLL